MRLKTPKKISTPYGGQIIYILPGKNRMIIHLKNSQKVRKRKRWSQVPTKFDSNSILKLVFIIFIEILFIFNY